MDSKTHSLTPKPWQGLYAVSCRGDNALYLPKAASHQEMAWGWAVVVGVAMLAVLPASPLLMYTTTPTTAKM